MAGNWEKYRASAYGALAENQLPEAETMLFAALQEAEEFAKDDPRLLVSLESLAEFYWQQQKYLQSEVLCRRVLKAYETALGPDHLDVGVLAHNLAMLCHSQKKYSEAEALYKKALSIKTRILGAGHLDVIVVYENYANLLMATQREAEAKHFAVQAKSVKGGRWARSGTFQAFTAHDPALGPVIEGGSLLLDPKESDTSNA